MPHSEISGSKDACASPERIAAGRVLHRLLAPRYPPFALTYLTSLILGLLLITRDAHYSVVKEPRVQPADLRWRLPLWRTLNTCALIVHYLYFFAKAGGDDRDRTGGLKLAKLALSQLSYIPEWWAILESNQGPLRYQHSALAN